MRTSVSIGRFSATLLVGAALSVSPAHGQQISSERLRHATGEPVMAFDVLEAVRAIHGGRLPVRSDALDLRRSAIRAPSEYRTAVSPRPGGPMYGLIGKMVAVPGKRDELADILLGGMGAMPGCLSYVVAADPSDPDALWVTEVWVDQESHRASLELPSVQAAIAKGRPLIAGFENRVETMPLGGHGLDADP